MARPLRHDIPGLLHHVTCRTNSGHRLFDDHRDYDVFLQELEETVVKFEWVLLSYCLMPNHVHLLVECPHAGLSDGMQRLESRFARRRHCRHGTYGHVYQGRFKSEPVVTDEHLLLTAGYIARNPVNASLCGDPGEWPWSSHRALVHESAGLVQPARLFELLAVWGGDGRSRYLNLLGCKTEGVEAPRPILGRPRLRELLAGEHAAGILEAHEAHGYGVREIAAELNCSPATISRRLKQARMKQGWVKRV